MLTLATTDSITVKLAAAHSTTAPTFVACWITNSNALGRLAGTFDGTTPVTAVEAPTSGNKLVSDLFVANRDTVAHTVTITHVVSGGASTVVWTEEIAAGETVNLLAPTRRGPTGPAGEGDVDGPASATDGNLVAFDGVTGKLLTDAGVAPSDLVESDAIVTEIGDPGSDDNIPSEQAVREALDALSPGGGAARWTAFEGFAATAWGYGTLALTAKIPGVDLEPNGPVVNVNLALPLRWRCDGDAAGDYRYGILRAFGGDVTHTPHQGTAQGGSYTADPFDATITLAADASSEDDYYNGMIVQIISGTGVGQRAIVVDYDGTSKIATLSVISESPAAIIWAEAADATSEYALCHALVAGQPLDADNILEMEYGDSDRVIVVNIPISGEYSGEAVDAQLYHALMGGLIPWGGAPARIVQAGAWNMTADTGSDPQIQTVPHVLNDNNGYGIAPGNDAAGTRPNWCEHGAVSVSHDGGNRVRPGTTLDCVLKTQGGNGDATDLTVILVLVLE
ncbi:MAG: hypothetical protein BWX86_00546 [Verrucomicrobia bacterium ADurb.Bin122]|nr:MAG: hypothetical protein BWX86_00546 [Verrucomicrobia bacterium ADurb.Bin122]